MIKSRKRSRESPGIDPGKTGAVALFDDTKSAASGLRWVIYDLPYVGEDLDGAAFRTWIQQHNPDHAGVENVNAIPRWSAVSNFKLGVSFGAVHSVLHCCGIKPYRVRSQAWKKQFDLLKERGGDKRTPEESRQFAIEYLIADGSESDVA